MHFINPDGSFNQTTIVRYTTEQLCKHGLKYTPEIQLCADVWIYPKEYFAPIGAISYEQIKITENTRTIHHYVSSWIEGRTANARVK